MASKKTFDFKLGDRLKIARSGEQGIVFGRAQYVDSSPSYLLHYVRADGSSQKDWLSESELELVESGRSEPESAAA